MKQLPFIFLFAILMSCNDYSKKIGSNLTAIEIMKNAHEKSGGVFWQNPKSLTLKGHGIFYKDGKSVKHEKHNMWRVFEKDKKDAHMANGKVRIESFKDGKPVFIVAYDGENTYDANGKQEKSEADKRWASNFGFGAIRHALEKEYQLQKMVDDTIHGKAVYQIKVLDKTKGETLFGIDKKEFKIVKVAFQTPKGWHHRIYSEFFTKPEYSWLQSGRVDLYYDNILANTIFWDDFEVNEKLPEDLFILN